MFKLTMLTVTTFLIGTVATMAMRADSNKNNCILGACPSTWFSQMATSSVASCDPSEPRLCTDCGSTECPTPSVAIAACCSAAIPVDAGSCCVADSCSALSAAPCTTVANGPVASKASCDCTECACSTCECEVCACETCGADCVCDACNCSACKCDACDCCNGSSCCTE